ncbi:tail fiber assembly protein [Marinomonas arenicola]|uniref:tail fiber assembly protein n=1 Tax=Marinomonas arenicola TaxID=569601 RepID=UPI00311FFF53
MKKPVFIDGLHPLIKWQIIKEYRTYLLTESDYTQIPDSPISGEQRAAWAGYRQTLRDIPNVCKDPDDVVWPTKPE